MYSVSSKVQSTQPLNMSNFIGLEEASTPGSIGQLREQRRDLRSLFSNDTFRSCGQHVGHPASEKVAKNVAVGIVQETCGRE